MSEEDRTRYMHHAHRMQTGVEFNKNKNDQTPKMLRVGINSAMSDQGGLATLLIQKGIITIDEYEKTVADAMQREADRYETEINKQHQDGKLRLGSLYPESN